MKAQEILVNNTGGGGGYGHPFDRELEKVKYDVINDFVSIDAALKEYGVVIDPKTLEINESETHKVRASR
jgi:N-methylhydantoinase B